MTLTTAFVVALLGLIGLFNLVALIQSVGDPDATVPGRIAQGIVAVIGLVGSIVIVMMNRR